MDNFATVKLELEEFLVTIINILNVLLVFDLKLMEVDKLQIFTHLVFVLDLALGLQDLNLVRDVLGLQLVDLCLFLFQLVKHVL